MADDGSNVNEADWAAAWIEQQRELLRQRTAAAGDFLNVWRTAWTAAADAQGSATQFTDALMRLPSLGLTREHTAAWRAVSDAQAECQKLEKELRDVLMKVQNDALDLLQQRIREREQQQKPLDGFRDLYDLWVECGEQVYAKVAHSESFSKLQGELGNATMRLRSRQQKVMEQGLKQFDLPTRAELNTVHRQLREQKAKLREHQELLAGFVEKMKMKPARRVSGAAKHAARKPARKQRRPR